VELVGGGVFLFGEEGCFTGEVAIFFEFDGEVETSGGGAVFFVEVLSVKGESRFEAEGVAGDEATGGDAEREGFFPEEFAFFYGAEPFEAVFAGVASGRDDDGGFSLRALGHRFVMRGDEVVAFLRDFGVDELWGEF